MAAHIVLLFLLFCKGERNCISVALGLSEEDQDFQITLSKGQQVLAHPESMENFFVKIKQRESQLQDEKDDRELNNFDYKSNAARKTDTLKNPETPAKSLIPKHSRELAVNYEKRSNLTKGETEEGKD